MNYSFTIDDNIFFLSDIFRNGYRSLFDSFYLKKLRDLHEQYGTKFTLNLFSEVHERYHENFGPFALQQFPDTYKEEWEDNAHWLRLAFHARSEFPNRPYLKNPFEQLAEDFDYVSEEINRFAGKAYTPTSIIHWAMVPKEAHRILAERGVKTLAGYFLKNLENSPWQGEYDSNYCLDDQFSAYVSEHKVLKDPASGIFFCSIDLLCNATPLQQIEPKLEAVMDNPEKNEAVILSTHEQYFWPQWKAPASWYDVDTSGVTIYEWIPDHFQRVERSIRAVVEKGYPSVFLHECWQ